MRRPGDCYSKKPNAEQLGTKEDMHDMQPNAVSVV